ncbi:MAG: ferritin-like domain-containing protein [Rhizobacter sp.]|nr:ferritin-like domain-containing protein [Chlorobiales bacterium]
MAILATGYTTEVQASNTYVAAAGLNLLVEPFLSIALQFKADHDAHAAAFFGLYNSAKASSDPTLTAPATNLLTAFPPKSSLPLTSETNVLIYALGLEILAAQVYATLAGGSLATSAGFTSFAKVLKLDANLRISSTNLSLISAATDIAACDMQHAIALRAAVVLFKAQSSATYILINGQPTGGTTLTDPATFPKYFGSSVTAQNPQDYITLA